jgi:outer membrane lipoprotein-sorting protein
MKTLILIFSAILLSSCVATPNMLGTAAAVAAKPTQESLKSYFDFENATNQNGEKVSIDQESQSNEFIVSVDDCAQKSIDKYTEDFLAESAEDASMAALGAAAAPAVGGALGGVLLAPVAIIAAPAALAYTAYNAVDAASQIAERFESEKEYALVMKQCINESGYVVNFKDLSQ